MRKDFERREGLIDVKKKIEYSKQLNSSRIKVLQTREDVVHGILDEVGPGGSIGSVMLCTPQLHVATEFRLCC